MAQVFVGSKQYLYQRFPNCGACPHLGGPVRPLGWWGALFPLEDAVVYIKDILILNEIWTQDKINILVCTLLG
jgi:hypothetical protein